MTKEQNSAREPGSFRDPCGLLFYSNGFIYHQINYTYKEHYDNLMDSGLDDALVESDLYCTRSRQNNMLTKNFVLNG